MNVGIYKHYMHVKYKFSAYVLMHTKYSMSAYLYRYITMYFTYLYAYIINIEIFVLVFNVT
jgi:hypothetical protein